MSQKSLFSNVIFYQLPNCELTDDEFLSALEMSPYAPCLKSQPVSVGWVPSVTDGSLLTVNNGALFMTLHTEEKKVPADVVKQEVKVLVDKFKKKEGKDPTAEQIKEWKAHVTLSLLPRAFSKHTETRMIISPDKKWLAIDASSANKAEALIKLLRSALAADEHSFATLPMRPTVNMEQVMTNWLIQKELPEKVEQGVEAKLSDSEGIVKVERVDLFGTDVRKLLEANYKVLSLALNYDGMSFKIDKTLTLKSFNVDASMLPEDEDYSTEEDADKALAYLLDVHLRLLVPGLQSLFKFLGQFCEGEESQNDNEVNSNKVA